MKSAVLPALQMVSAWAAALQGSGDLGRAADQVMALLPVRDVRLLRVETESGVTKRIHASDGAPALETVDMARCVFALPAVVEKGNETDERIVVLGKTADACDLFVLRLFRPLSLAQDRLLKELAVVMVASWGNRQPGLVTARIIALSRRHMPRGSLTSRAVAILDYSNPYGLSPAEFRVCAMIGQGLAARRIAQELHLSEATVRSHQRAIYAKTELGGQMEVMYHLQAYPTAQSLLHSLQGRAA
ncbi:MAG: response regulator transcription factor [Paracoccaceae bacterium]